MSMLIVHLRGETPEEVLAEGGDTTGALARLLSALERDAYHHLPYIDPWGLTIFNGLQMKAVIPELVMLRADPASRNLVNVLDRIIEMAERCRDNVHLYLEFEGD